MSKTVTLDVADVLEVVKNTSGFYYPEDRVAFLESLGIDVEPRTLRVLVDIEIEGEDSLEENADYAADNLDWYDISSNVVVVSAVWKD